MSNPKEPRSYKFSDYFSGQTSRPNELKRLMDQLEVPDLLAELVEETGMTEDEIIRLALSRRTNFNRSTIVTII